MVKPLDADLVIVGAGPAGLAAAVTVAQTGLRVIVIDEQPRIGGQIFRQPPERFQVQTKNIFATPPFGPELLAAVQANQHIDLAMRTTAWGIFEPSNGQEGLLIGISGPEDAKILRTRAALIATGAYDTPIAFPGWTLPGIMTAGGVQTLLKSQFVLSAKRYVLAGSHPLLFVLAHQLLEAGAEIAEVAIARSRPSMMELIASLPGLAGHSRLGVDLLRCLWSLRRHRVPLRFSTMIARATGTESGVDRVVLQDLDRSGKPMAGGERRHEGIDGLAIGYGLLPNTELGRQAGCAVDWVPERGGWILRHDAWMRSSQPNIYVAGEPAGIGGAKRAYLQGKLAGLVLSADLNGAAANQHIIRRAQAKLARTDKFARLIERSFALDLTALERLVTPETLLCRCEEISAGAIDRFLQENQFVRSLNAIKLGCRAGMGPCQGRYCQLSLALRLANRYNMKIEALGQFTVQAPVRPVPVCTLAALAAP